MMKRGWGAGWAVLIAWITFGATPGAWAWAPEQRPQGPECVTLGSFFDAFVGSWAGTGTVESVGYSGQSTYALEFKIAQIALNSYERFATASLWNGEVQDSWMDFDVSGGLLNLVGPGELTQQALVLESTPRTLSFAVRKPIRGKTYDLVYRWQLSENRLRGEVEMDDQGQKVSESRFDLMRQAD